MKTTGKMQMNLEPLLPPFLRVSKVLGLAWKSKRRNMWLHVPPVLRKSLGLAACVQRRHHLQAARLTPSIT